MKKPLLVLTLLVICYAGLWRMSADPAGLLTRVSVAPDPHRVEGQDMRPIVQYPPRGAEFVALVAVAAVLHLYLLLVLVERRPRPAAHLAFAGASLMALELALRGYIAAVAPPYHPDPLLMWRPRDRGGQLDVLGHPLNPFGLRPPYVPPQKTPGRLRLMAIGDSATYGVYVNDGESYPALLAKSCGGAEVINAAVPGYSTLQGRFLAPDVLQYFRPDVVTVGFNNDSIRSEREDLSRIPPPGLERSLMGILYQCESYLLLRRVVMNAAIGVVGEHGHEENVFRVSPADHRANLVAIVRAAQAVGAKVAVLTMPTPHAAGYDEGDAQAASDCGVPHVDLNPICPDAAARRYLLPDVVHPTPEGHQRIAALLLRTLRAKGIL